MTLQELNKSAIAELPKSYKCYFPDFIKDIFDNYIRELQNLSPQNRLHQEKYVLISQKLTYVQKLANEIHMAINDYFNGNVKSCYKRLEEVIEEERDLFERLITSPKDQMTIQNIHPRGLFRIRKIVNPTSQIDRKELFHVPFQYRHNVATARYSIPGLPCLYLSSSLHIAKKELGLRKSLNKVYVSRFEASPDFNMRILDFGYQPELLGDWNCQCFDRIVFPRIIFWPLIAACSISVNCQKATFKPEYIVPQFLFQIASTLFNFDGIRYFSTKVGYERPVNINYAIKVKHIHKTEYCTWLKDQFLLTTPILWDEIKSITEQSHSMLLQNEKCQIRQGKKMIDYIETEYNQLEQKIETLSLAKI
ncbi:hypothetical protein CHISP_0887 [Chitinispirillum alkaliphilum]|nr:hypothetical protein CHISP_0887 [Chitinispirillum alkaliphilum]